MIAATTHRSYEVTLKTHNSRDLPTLFNATILRDESGRVTGSFALVTDVSRLKAVEQALQEAKEEIEDQFNFL